MPRIIAIANHKGGVGKTTTTYNLAHALARDGRTRVLVCDVDPQAMLTKLLAVQPQLLSASLATLLVPFGTPLEPEQLIHSTSMPGVFLLPAASDLANVELQLTTKINRELTLRRALEPFKDFDFILLDCPPDLNLLNTNAL